MSVTGSVRRSRPAGLPADMPTTSSGSTPTARPRFCTSSTPPVDADSLNWEHWLLAQLNSHLPEALAPVPALDGSTWFWFHDRPVWLTPWAPGHCAGPVDRHAVATVLGRLHASPVELSTRPNHARLLQQPLPPLRRIPASLEPWRTVIAQARTDLNGLPAH